MKIVLHIQRLLLEGLPVTQRDGPAISAALEQELSRLLRESGLPAGINRGGTQPKLNGASLYIANPVHSGSVGADIAGSIYSALPQTRTSGEKPHE